MLRLTVILEAILNKVLFYRTNYTIKCEKLKIPNTVTKTRVIISALANAHGHSTIAT